MKRWVLWLCIIALVISELLLFSAKQQRSKALADASEARQQLQQLRDDIAQGQSSSDQSQRAEIARLRSEHQDLLRLRNDVRQLSDTNDQLTQKLKDAHALIRQQQAQLQEWQTASQQAEQEMQASQAADQAPPQPQQAQNPATAAAQRNACINNLRRIDAAKQQWALENNKGDDAIPTATDLMPYFKDGVFPSCPGGGLYSINAVGLPPTCTIPGHALPQ
jgi:chromosome segregation ATPase